MSKLEELKKSILDDGIIDHDEVKLIKAALYDDGTIDQEEADFVFALNDAVSGKKNHQSWNALFIKSICDFLLNDEISPGEIDTNEAKWLADKIGEDGQVDALERELLETLKSRAKSFPEILSKLI